MSDDGEAAFGDHGAGGDGVTAEVDELVVAIDAGGLADVGTPGRAGAANRAAEGHHVVDVDTGLGDDGGGVGPGNINTVVVRVRHVETIVVHQNRGGGGDDVVRAVDGRSGAAGGGIDARGGLKVHTVDEPVTVHTGVGVSIKGFLIAGSDEFETLIDEGFKAAPEGLAEVLSGHGREVTVVVVRLGEVGVFGGGDLRFVGTGDGRTAPGQLSGDAVLREVVTFGSVATRHRFTVESDLGFGPVAQNLKVEHKENVVVDIPLGIPAGVFHLGGDDEVLRRVGGGSGRLEESEVAGHVSDGLLTGAGLFTGSEEFQFGIVVVDVDLDGTEVVLVGQILHIDLEGDGITISGVVLFGEFKGLKFEREVGLNEGFRADSDQRRTTEGHEQREDEGENALHSYLQKIHDYFYLPQSILTV